jgi:hypothetical protein
VFETPQEKNAALPGGNKSCRNEDFIRQSWFAKLLPRPEKTAVSDDWRRDSPARMPIAA